MSPPAEKARPAPVITSARSSDGGSCDSCATEACTASPISTVMAFRLSGRSSVNTLTPLCSSSSTRTAVLSLRTAVLSFCTCGTARKQAACSGGSSLDERISMAATPVATKGELAAASRALLRNLSGEILTTFFGLILSLTSYSQRQTRGRRKDIASCESVH